MNAVMAQSEFSETKIFPLSSASEELLWIREIKESGSESAFTKLMKKYQERVYWLARRTVLSHDDADEITQEVFITVYEKLYQFREDSQFFTWLYRITTNKIFLWLRKKKIRQMVGLENISELFASTESDAEEKMISVEWNDSLKSAIAKLPEKQRMVFNLRYYDELPYEQISEILNTSVGGLKANYFHAVQKIKETMEHENM